MDNIKFDNFYIFGPEVFNQKSELTVLYQYPYKSKKENAEILKYERRLMTEKIFPDGNHFIEDDEEFKKGNIDIKTTYEHIISKNSIQPYYNYIIRFRCSPLTRPAASAFHFFEDIIDSNKNFDEFIIQYLQSMKNYFISDAIIYHTNNICPTCLFAFCFATDNPIHSYYFQLIEELIDLETSIRTNSINLTKLLSIKIGNEGPKEEETNQNDNFVLIDKIEDDSSNFFFINDKNESNQTKNKRKGKVYDIEKIIEDVNNSTAKTLCSWPNNAFLEREKHLVEFYNGCFDQPIIEKFNEINHTIFEGKDPNEFDIARNLCIYGAEKFFELIELHDLIIILSYLFLEYNIIVYGAEVEQISRVISFLTWITYPFLYRGTFHVFMFEEGLRTLQSPVYFMAGIIKTEKNIRTIHENQYIDYSRTLIIDIDDNNIKWPLVIAPFIPYFSQYIKCLKPYCSSKKNEVKRKKSSDVIIIRNVDVYEKSKVYYPKLKKIEQIVSTIMQLNSEMLINKIQYQVFSRAVKKEVHQNYCKAFGSDENNIAFINEFVETQMLTCYCEDVKKSVNIDDIENDEIAT